MAKALMAEVTVRGIRPLWWHHFGPEAIPLEKTERTGVAGNDPVEWKRTVLVTNEGQLYLEPEYVFGCIRDGAKYTKKGKGSIQKMVSATLQVVDDFVLVDRFMPDGTPTNDKQQPVYIDVRGVRNPSTGARNVRYRVAASAGWRAAFRLMWDPTIVSRGEMEAAVRDAGRFSGLGNGRSIGYGRFEVEAFAVEDGG